MIAGLEKAMQNGAALQADKLKGQMNFFGQLPTENDYANKNDTQRQSDDMKLLKFVESNFDNHNPDYDSLKGVQPPEVKWVAGSNVLNS